MKLNLLPTYVSKEGQSKVAWLVAGVMIIGSIAGGLFAIMWSNGELSAAKQRVDDVRPLYEKALATSKRADDIMASSVVIDRNLKLSQAMMAHNSVYPDLYREVLSYAPSFFRVNSIQAAPAGEQTTVTMQGVLQTYQQYADVMLAMLRIPGATNVTRAGFTDIRPTVPGLNEQDQIGSPVKPGAGNLPSNPQARMEELIARANQEPTGFLNVGGFGDPDATQKGAMPNWSPVTITVTLARNIQTPNPRATLTSQGGANTAPSGSGSPSGGGPAPSGPTGGGGRPTQKAD
ncbi:MAG: hypothetical protein JSS66_11275 [Armatimonadetes bacterium]|nr:hypothetical protein [Armatimonadota bacterium]